MTNPDLCDSKRARCAALAGFAGDRRFWVFVISAALLQASHQLYYGFGTLYWRGLGFSDTVIGGLWAEGVVAEILLLRRCYRLFRRCYFRCFQPKEPVITTG